MNLPPLTYLTVDSLAEGVGASQVTPYVERLARRGLDVTVHSCEPRQPTAELRTQLEAVGVHWRPHDFGRNGSVAGVARALRLAWAGRGASLVHARGDLAALAALLGRSTCWVWDMRAFFADQRIELGSLRAGSPQERLLRALERRAAQSSDAIVTLAAAAVPVLERRHGPGMAAKATVIPTCVDLDRFQRSPLPAAPPVRLLFSGSLNRYYDVPLMLMVFDRARRRLGAEMTVLSPAETPWDRELAEHGVQRRTARAEDVPGHVRTAHVGLAVCRTDVGDSLKAAMPTKVAEFLAAGRPVVVNRGLGDMDRLLEQDACGVVVEGRDEPSIERAVTELERLLADPETAARCRHLAETHFDLDSAVDRLIDTYRRAIDGHASGRTGARGPRQRRR